MRFFPFQFADLNTCLPATLSRRLYGRFGSSRATARKRRGAFHFGSWDAPGTGRAMGSYTKRTGRDATHAFAIGDADTILARIAEYVDAGVSKFILRLLGDDDEAIQFPCNHHLSPRMTTTRPSIPVRRQR